jgi:hypothetical protein
MADSAVLIALGLLWVLVLVLCVLVIAALRHLAFLYERVNPMLRLSTNAYLIQVNEPLPLIVFQQPGAGNVRLARFGARPMFVLVVQVSCTACHSILRLARSELNRALHIGWQPLVLVAGDERTAIRLQHEHQLDDVVVLADPRRATSSTWGISSTPAALVVEGGVVRKVFPVLTADQVRRTLASPPSDSLAVLPLSDSAPRHVNHSAEVSFND